MKFLVSFKNLFRDSSQTFNHHMSYWSRVAKLRRKRSGRAAVMPFRTYDGIALASRAIGTCVAFLCFFSPNAAANTGSCLQELRKASNGAATRACTSTEDKACCIWAREIRTFRNVKNAMDLHWLQLLVSMSNSKLTIVIVTPCPQLTSVRQDQTMAKTSSNGHESLVNRHFHWLQLLASMSNSKLTIVIATPCPQFTSVRQGQAMIKTSSNGHESLVNRHFQWLQLVVGVSNSKLTIIIVTPCPQFTSVRQGQAMIKTSSNGHESLVNRHFHWLQLVVGVSNSKLTMTIVTPCQQFTSVRQGQSMSSTSSNGHESLVNRHFHWLPLFVGVSNSKLTMTMATPCPQFTSVRQGQAMSVTSSNGYEAVVNCHFHWLQLGNGASNSKLTTTIETPCPQLVLHHHHGVTWSCNKHKPLSSSSQLLPQRPSLRRGEQCVQLFAFASSGDKTCDFCMV